MATTLRSLLPAAAGSLAVLAAALTLRVTAMTGAPSAPEAVPGWIPCGAPSPDPLLRILAVCPSPPD
ncbi:hypothetical protein ACFY19_38615 [Streptosporangium saharense]|uniref:Uncharacterized protein n=1 Tax=Streptosporangium saharense TaxID=1706840 RepID=A0A7W7VLK4_9ACTN|nr:hypothetical protein [Streptosporangium saharense]MBB4914683.1 hypothetical protein [Streptosporangium saharense]